MQPWPGHEDPATAQVVYLTFPGQVIENRIFRRAVIVQAPNITFRNVRFQHPRDFWMLLVDESAGLNENANILVEDSHFDGMASPSQNAGIGGPGWTLRRVEIERTEDGAKLQKNTDVYDSWCHNLIASTPDPHYDCFQSLGGFDVDMVHNTIEIGVGEDRNAAIFLKTDGGPITDSFIYNNRLLGGGWTVSSVSGCGWGMCWGPPTGTVIQNNRFGDHAYGYITYEGSIVRCGNVRDDNGQPIDAAC